MNSTSQRFCLWCGPAILVGFGIGLVLAGYLPPPRANATPREVAELYSHHTDRLRLAFLIMAVSGACFGPFAAAIAIQIKRIEGRSGPMTFTQVALGGANAVIVSIGAMVMIVAAFRPHRNPDVLQALNDLAWFFFVIWVFPFLLQLLSIALAILTEPKQTVYPRWVGYFNLWLGLGSFAGLLPPFFKTGAFAWQGVFGFWIAAAIFLVWIAVMTITTLRAIEDEARTATALAS